MDCFRVLLFAIWACWFPCSVCTRLNTNRVHLLWIQQKKQHQIFRGLKVKNSHTITIVFFFLQFFSSSFKQFNSYLFCIFLSYYLYIATHKQSTLITECAYSVSWPTDSLVSALISHQCDPGSIPDRLVPSYAIQFLKVINIFKHI